MKIIILGAGRVGRSLVQSLHKQHEISIIDQNTVCLRKIEDQFDIRTICGSASHPNILENAGAKDADMIIAVTDNDEVNIIACQISYSLFKIPSKIAKLSNKTYAEYSLFSSDNIPVDLVINPSELVTRRILSLIKNSGSFQIVDFADGNLQLVGTSVSNLSLLNNKNIKEFERNLRDIEVCVVNLYRESKDVAVDNETVFCTYDDVFFITKKVNVPKVLAEFQPHHTNFRKILFAGGGNIGVSLAQHLEEQCSVKIIENSAEKCHLAAGLLNSTTVLLGNASDANLLKSEGVNDTNLFCAVTNDDETNIVSAMLAKKMGVQSTIVLVNSLNYTPLTNHTPLIDYVISPQRITVDVIQSYLRKSDIINMYSLYSGKAEAMEIVVHGSSDNSPIVGRAIGTLNLPHQIVIAAVIDKNQIIIADNNYHIQSGNTVVVVIKDTDYVPIVEKMFQVLPICL